MKDIVLCDIDRDTQGLAGAPDIGDSIYEKIDNADIFIADVTIINQDYAGRKTPNPNVLIELGYAIKALGWDRIILLYNKDFGEIEELPFDINHRRMTSFSLEGCGEKAKIREYVLSCIATTIQILDQEHRLYGSSADVVKAQRTLGELLRTGLEQVWDAYKQHKKDNEIDLYDKILPISEAQLALVEKVHDLLTEEQYHLANTILFHIKMSRLGSDEMHEWEFADQLVSDCFEKLYIEFIDNICELPIEYILKAEVLELLNILSFDKYYEYQEVRMSDGRVVFSTAINNLYAYDESGNVLCQGKLEAEGFTGYKRTHDYEGEYVAGKRQGEGKEYCMSRYDNYSRCLLREGIWDNDIFIEGRINGVLAESVNGKIEFVQGYDGGILTKKDWVLDFEEEGYQFTDVYLKNSKYTIIEESMKDVLEEYYFDDASEN